MRLLLDENISPKICSLLRDAGHDSVHVRDLGRARATDDEVLARAAEDR